MPASDASADLPIERLRPDLFERDPMLMHALEAHGAARSVDLTGIVNLMADARRRAPEIELTPMRHQIVWRTAQGFVRRDQQWVDYAGVEPSWHPTATFADVWPESVLAAVAGRRLDALLDLPGADAWEMVVATRVPGFHVDVLLSRL